MKTLSLKTRRKILSVTFGFAVLWGGHAASVEAAPEPTVLEPASSGGFVALDHALARLGTHKRLLVIAAHPDDEDTTLLTWVSRGLGGEAAYLSLSRGDGGQNLIGSELGVGLGLLRSRELESARRVDGARQFFSRAFDFGYTRSLEETLQRWPKEVLLEDAVRVVRQFKPQILMSVFPPTAQAGHGQHQAAGLVAEEIFDLAADPDAFPHLLDEGLAPWKIQTFYRSAFFSSGEADVELPLGTLDPMSGRSILQIALESRSQHRCQDMGSLQPLGDFRGRLAHVRGVRETELFDGSDTRLAAIADLLPVGDLRQSTARDLERVAELAHQARRDLDPGEPTRTTPSLVEMVRRLRGVEEALEASLDGAGASAVHHALDLVREKRVWAERALAIAAQVLVDAFTDRAEVVPGDEFEVRAVFWNAGPLSVEDVEIEAVGVGGWRLLGSREAEAVRGRFSAEVDEERVLTFQVPKEAAPSRPYFLENSRRGDLYDWQGVSGAVRGQPFDAPPLSLRFRFLLEGLPITLEREVVERQRDQAWGEVRRPLRVVPALEISAEPALLVWPVAGRPSETLRVTVTSNVDRPMEAQVHLKTPEGWPTLDLQPMTLRPHGRQDLEISIERPADLQPGRQTLEWSVAAREEGHSEARYDMAFPLIQYSHVRPTPLPVPAKVEVVAADLEMPRLGPLGYVRGASDRVPEILARVGLEVEVLDADMLASGDLGRFDAIVVGSRAYEVDAALGTHNERLLDYARDGGLVLVQYQQYQYVRGGFAPHALEIRRPHDRVTDETAPIEFLVPDHPVMRVPNELGPADTEGWVQERGLYFAGTWDPAWQPLLSMADPGGEPKQGGLLVAPLGKGTYVYTGLAFFRQLPAGVPGAWRLFANLLALATPEEDRP